VRGNLHARCGVGENPEIISKGYLSLYWEVLIGNCDSLLFLGGADATTLEYVSKSLGKETIRSINNSRSYGKQGSNSMSYNKTGRELMTPDELRVMDNKNCVLFIRGEYPFFTEKYPYKKHPNYKYTGDASDKYLFDVKKMLQTGQNMAELSVPDNMPLRVFKEAQIADTRESEHVHRQYTRSVETRTAQGQETLRIRPMKDILPGIEIPPEQRTPEQERLLAEAGGEYAFDGVNIPPKKDLPEYQAQLFAIYGGIPDSELEGQEKT